MCVAPWSCTSLVLCILVFASHPSETGNKEKLKTQPTGITISVSSQEGREGRVSLADSNLSGLRANAAQPSAIKRWYNMERKETLKSERHISNFQVVYHGQII